MWTVRCTNINGTKSPITLQTTLRLSFVFAQANQPYHPIKTEKCTKYLKWIAVTFTSLLCVSFVFFCNFTFHIYIWTTVLFSAQSDPSFSVPYQLGYLYLSLPSFSIPCTLVPHFQYCILMSNLYFNNLPVTRGWKFIYADDICLAIQVQYFSELECSLTSDMARMSHFCRQWWLKPSASKTISSVFHLHNTVNTSTTHERQFIWMASAFGLSATQPISSWL